MSPVLWQVGCYWWRSSSHLAACLQDHWIILHLSHPFWEGKLIQTWVCICASRFVHVWAYLRLCLCTRLCVQARVYLKAEPSLVTMPTHLTNRQCICLNEFILKLMFASVFSVSCVHTLNSYREEALFIAKSHLGEIAYWFLGETWLN